MFVPFQAGWGDPGLSGQFAVVVISSDDDLLGLLSALQKYH